MSLPSLKDLKVQNQTVFLRTNYDVPLSAGGEITDETRIQKSLKTIRYLLAKKAKVVIGTHLDRPGGQVVPGLKLKPVVERLQLLLPSKKISFSPEIIGEKTKRLLASLKPGEILVLENLRFDPGETKNETVFAQGLAGLAEFYVNDAFAAAHRKHASLVSLPLFLKSALGLDFLREIKVLAKLREKPRRPVVLILGGKKKSKIKIARKLIGWVDYLLVGGDLVAYNGLPDLIKHPKIIGRLAKNGEDISLATIKEFKKIIKKAKTIVWTGPLGVFEEKKYARGTREIAEAVVAGRAFTAVGGGETEAALSQFKLISKINYVSSGGGAMLSFLAEGTLPALEAIRGGKND